MSLLGFHDVTKTYDGTTKPAVADVSLTVDPGEDVAIVGPSGAGKTTLLRLATGALRPDSGRVTIDGDPDPDRTQTALVYQEGALLERRSVLSNVVVGTLGSQSRLRGLLEPLYPRDPERAIQLLERAGIAEYADTRVDQLSSGERQRVACVRALIQESRLLLADEPTANLDPTTSQRILDLLSADLDDRSLIVVIHDIDLALEHFERVVGFSGGTVRFDKPASRVSAVDVDRLFDESATAAGSTRPTRAQPRSKPGMQPDQ